MRFAKVSRYDQGETVSLEGRLLFQSSEYEVYCEVTEQLFYETVERFSNDATKVAHIPMKAWSILSEVEAINHLLFEHGQVRSSRTIRPQTYW